MAPARSLRFLDSLDRVASSLTEPDPSEPVCDRRIVTSAPFPTQDTPMPFVSVSAHYHLPPTAGGIVQTAAEKRNLDLSNELLTLKKTLKHDQVQRLGKLPTIPFLAAVLGTEGHRI